MNNQKIKKMKSKKTILLLSALAALCLLSCNNDHDPANVNPVPVRFTAAIGREAIAKPQSRAAGTDWAAMDKIGVFMVVHSGTTIAGGAENKQYITGNGDGAFTAAIGDQIYYPMDNSAVDFIAYYPHAAGAQLATALPVEIATVQTEAAQPTFDLMWARADNAAQGYTKDQNTTVALTFGHCLSKLTMNCKVDPSVGAPELLADATVTIHGMNTHNTFDLATGTLGATPETPADITPRKLSAASTGFHGTYDAIILPDTYADGVVTVDFTIDGETFTWNVKSITFDPGYEYLYEVLITRTGVTATGTIEDWTTKPMGGVETE